MTSVESSRHSRSARSRTSARQRLRSRSRIAHPREIANQLEELLPFLALRGEHVAPRRGDRVVAAAPLARLFDPAALNPFPFLELVESRVERREVEGERAAGSFL